MEEKKRKKEQSRNLRQIYRRSIPRFLLLEIVTKLLLLIISQLLSFAAQRLVAGTGRAAVTSGDLPYFVTSWQGWAVLLIGILVLVFYAAFDINAIVIMCDNVLHNRGKKLFEIIKEAFVSIKIFKSPRTFVIILYMGLIAPLLGAAIGLSATEDFYVPDFIMSVISGNFWLYLAYILGMIALLFVGFLNVFIFQFLLLQQDKAKDAFLNAQALLKKHWKNFLKRYLLFLLQLLLVSAILLAVFVGLPLLIIPACVQNETTAEYLLMAFFYLGMILYSFYLLLVKPFQLMKITTLYEEYQNNYTEYPVLKKSKKTGIIILAAAVLSFLVSIPLSPYFDTLFPGNPQSKVIAHRIAGHLDAENSLEGFQTAAAAGAYASELDVQRTKDGKYIINHDNTFKRLCGVDKTSMEMTQDEILALEINDPANPFGTPGHIPTLEQVYEQAEETGLHLYVEFKGATADRQMAEDAYAMAKETGVLDQCTFICLDYTLIDYLETAHSDANTGYLCFFAFGDIQDLNCDELLLEEEIATTDTVSKISEAGKKTIVWTANTINSAAKCYYNEVDGIVTDEVTMAINYKEFISSQPPVVRMMIMTILLVI